MLKIIHARLQQYINWKFPDVQAGFRKDRGTRDQIANICRLIEEARKFQKNIYFSFQFSSVWSLSRGQFAENPWTAVYQASLSITNPWSLFKLMFIEWVMPSNHLILCSSPFSSCLQSFPALGSFQINQLFASGGQSIWSFSFSISPSNEYSGLISFRMDRLDLLAVQGTLKSLLQHPSSKALILWCSAFFIVFFFFIDY